MIAVVFRFRVANGTEGAAHEAFANRPRLVEDAPGFLGDEVFRGTDDPALFYLVTRWTDAASYEAWRGSEAHRRSDAWVPPGLELELASTTVRRGERIPGAAPATRLEERTADAAPLLAGFLARSRSVCFLAAASDGRLTECNDAFATLAATATEALLGTPIWALLTADDAVRLRDLVAAGGSAAGQLRLNFVDAEQSPFTLDCEVDVRPDGIVLVGEAAGRATDRANVELLGLNNELAALSREHARRGRELEAARAELERSLADLESSHWHLRKIQEVLPICMECGKVKTGAAWEDVVHYLRANALFLSHGYCPDCIGGVMERFGLVAEDGEWRG